MHKFVVVALDHSVGNNHRTAESYSKNKMTARGYYIVILRHLPSNKQQPIRPIQLLTPIKGSGSDYEGIPQLKIPLNSGYEFH